VLHVGETRPQLKAAPNLAALVCAQLDLLEHFQEVVLQQVFYLQLLPLMEANRRNHLFY
jgi:hypothetical protein